MPVTQPIRRAQCAGFVREPERCDAKQAHVAASKATAVMSIVATLLAWPAVVMPAYHETGCTKRRHLKTSTMPDKTQLSDVSPNQPQRYGAGTLGA